MLKTGARGKGGREGEADTEVRVPIFSSKKCPQSPNLLLLISHFLKVSSFPVALHSQGGGQATVKRFLSASSSGRAKPPGSSLMPQVLGNPDVCGQYT